MNNKNAASSLSPRLTIYILSLFVAILNSCVLSPIYVQIESNISFEYTAFPIVLNYAVLIFDILYISFLFSALAYSVYGVNKGCVDKKETFILTITIVVLKHVLNLLVSSVIDGYIDISFDIPLTIYSIIIDLLVLLTVALIANNNCKKHFAHVRAMIKASKYIDTIEYNEMNDVFPFKGFFRIKKNPVLTSAFAGAIITSLIFILQRLFADIVVLGAPSTLFEMLDIGISYLVDILFGLLSYTASYFALSFIFLKEYNK